MTPTIRPAVALFFALAPLAVVLPPATVDAASLASAAQAGAADMGDDVGLQREIRQALAAEPALRGVHITILSHGGDVALAGVVATPEQRARAQQAAASVRGVRRLDNVITIAGR